MKKIKIYSVGSCITETREGSYEALLEYGEQKKYISGKVKDATANRCIIIGFIEAVKKLKEPCKIDLVATTKLGLSGLQKNKGPNIELLKQLIDLLEQKNCEFEFNEATGQGKEINAYIHSARIQNE